jgi:hypothetical protein
MTPYYYYKGEYQPDCWLHHKMATSPPQPFSLCNRRKETMIVFDRRGDRSLLNAFPWAEVLCYAWRMLYTV